MARCRRFRRLILHPVPQIVGFLEASPSFLHTTINYFSSQRGPDGTTGTSLTTLFVLLRFAVLVLDLDPILRMSEPGELSPGLTPWA